MLFYFSVTGLGLSHLNLSWKEFKPFQFERIVLSIEAPLLWCFHFQSNSLFLIYIVVSRAYTCNTCSTFLTTKTKKSEAVYAFCIQTNLYFLIFWNSLSERSSPFLATYLDRVSNFEAGIARIFKGVFLLRINF